MAIRKILEADPGVRKEVGAATVRRRMASLYCDLAHTWFSSGSTENTRSSLAKAIRLWPTNMRYYAFYAASLLQPSHAMAVRNAFRRMRGEAPV